LLQNNAPGPVLIVRFREDMPRGMEDVTQVIASIDSGLLFRSTSLQVAADRQIGPQRLFAWTSGLLSVLGFVLAAIGMYGLAAQSGLERTREFGIRLALGADRRRIMTLAARSALTVTLIGAPIGLVLAALGSRLVASQLFGVTATNPILYGLATATLVAVMAIASGIPAWIASRVNPVHVMRAE
jgi:putative ABC transport system permease protein